MDMRRPSMHSVQQTQALTSGLFRARSIGAILVDTGILSPADADRITREQKERNLLFGDAAVALGLLTQQDIDSALARQYDYHYLNVGSEALSDELVAAFKPFSPIAESLRELRAQLMVRWFGQAQNQRVLSIVSTERGEGRSFVAANLAVVFSQLGERTLLIDADMRNPRQHQLFNIPSRPAGLSSLLSGRAGLEAIVTIPSLAGLSVLPAGTPPPNPQELLARSKFAELLEHASQSYDVVLVDTPAAATAADARIAGRAGAALMVVRAGHTCMPQVQAMTNRLNDANVSVVGAILNKF